MEGIPDQGEIGCSAGPYLLASSRYYGSFEAAEVLGNLQSEANSNRQQAGIMPAENVVHIDADEFKIQNGCA